MHTWIDWARKASCSAVTYAYGRVGSADKTSALDHMIQAACERPEDFARAFAPVLGSSQTNPLTTAGEGALMSLVENGICDDWEIYLQWREDGYAVVPESKRRGEDARFRFHEAQRLLDTLTGGRRTAPGEADEAALVQSMYETERPVHTPRGNQHR